MPDESSLKPPSRSFSLSKTNAGLLVLACAVIGVPHLLVMGGTAQNFGELTGRLIGVAALPLIFSWMAWLVTGRRVGAARVTFNVLLIMAVLGHFGQIGRKARERAAMDKLADRMESFRKEVSNSASSGTPEGFSNLVQSAQSTFEELAEVSSESDKRGWEVMAEFTNEIAQKSEEWQASYMNLFSERMLDPVSLREESEMSRQKAAYEHHLKLTARAREDFLSITDVMKERLEKAGAGKAMMTSIIRGLTTAKVRQQAIFEKLTQAQTDYCNNAIAALTLLKTESDKWALQDGNAVMEENLRKDFLGRLGGLDQQASLIQDLWDKLSQLAVP